MSNEKPKFEWNSDNEIFVDGEYRGCVAFCPVDRVFDASVYADFPTEAEAKAALERAILGNPPTPKNIWVEMKDDGFAGFFKAYKMSIFDEDTGEQVGKTKRVTTIDGVDEHILEALGINATVKWIRNDQK